MTMKKIAFLFATVALLTACTSNKPQQQEVSEAEIAYKRPAKDLNISFEEQQIRAGISVQLDSLTAAWMRVGKSPLKVSIEEKIVALNEDEKKVVPDFLINPDDIMDKLETLSFKYRAIAIMSDDKEVADLYGMPDVYSEPLSKLAAEVNDPAIKFAFEHPLDSIEMSELYAIEEQYGRANYFWEAAATLTIEQLYVMSMSQDIFLKNFTDKDAEDITYRIVLLLDAFDQLSDYNLELRRLYNVLRPLEMIDAISVDQLREQLTKVKSDVSQARASLFL